MELFAETPCQYFVLLTSSKLKSLIKKYYTSNYNQYSRVLARKEKNSAFYMNWKIKCNCGSGHTVSSLKVVPLHFC